MAFMPQYAPFAVLALMGAVGLIAFAGAVFLYGLWRKRHDWSRKAAIGAALVAGGYLGVLLIVSFTSHERVLALGERKYFCEIDCHEAYTIAGVRQTPEI